jgi:hypothetical protein
MPVFESRGRIVNMNLSAVLLRSSNSTQLHDHHCTDLVRITTMYHHSCVDRCSIAAHAIFVIQPSVKTSTLVSISLQVNPNARYHNVYLSFFFGRSWLVWPHFFFLQLVARGGRRAYLQRKYPGRGVQSGENVRSTFGISSCRS